MINKRRVAAASIIAAAGATVAIDVATGSSIADSVTDFYSANPVGAGLATAAGLYFVACLASQKVRKANVYVVKGVGRAVVATGRGARSAYRTVRAHPTAGVACAGAAVGIAALVLTLTQSGPVGPQGPQGTIGSQGRQGVPGSAGSQGVPGKDGNNYVLTDKDKREILGYVTPVPGPTGLPGKNGKSPSAEDLERAVDAYMKAHPLPTAPTSTPLPTSTPVPTSTPLPTSTPVPPATPVPYALPAQSEASHDSVKSIVSRDSKSFSAASGVQESTWKVLLNGISVGESELERLVIDKETGKFYLHIVNDGKTYNPDRSASFKTIVSYLETKTTAAERAGIKNLGPAK